MRGGPSAFPWASHPTVTSDARQGEDRPSDTGLRSRPRHHPDLQPTRSTHNVRLSCRSPTLRGAGAAVPQRAVLGEDARLEERLHQGQDTFVSDPLSHSTHKSRVRDFVEARRDVTFDHPLVGVGDEHDRISDRIMRPASGTEPVAAREKETVMFVTNSYEWVVEGDI